MHLIQTGETTSRKARQAPERLGQKPSPEAVDDAFQLLGQGLGDSVQFNQATSLKFDVRSLQIVSQRSAKAVGDTNPFTSQKRVHSG
jgi:hypothetical protein